MYPLDPFHQSPNYQPLRAGLTFTKVPPSPTPAHSVGIILATGGSNNDTPHCITDHVAATAVLAVTRTAAHDGTRSEPLVTMEPCSDSNQAQLWEKQPDGDGVRLVNYNTGRCFDAAYGKIGTQVYAHSCVGGRGQTWSVPSGGKNASGTIVNIAAKTCVSSADPNGTSTLAMEQCGGSAGECLLHFSTSRHDTLQHAPFTIHS
jgi:hypothetical protein